MGTWTRCALSSLLILYIFLSCEVFFVNGCTDDLGLVGLRIESQDALLDYEEEPRSVSKIVPDEKIRIRLLGCKMDLVQNVLFTPSDRNCSESDEGALVPEMPGSPHHDMFTVYVLFTERKMYHVCLQFKPDHPQAGEYIHQGTSIAKRILVKDRILPIKIYYMPVPLQIAIITVLLFLSGMFSGLNLGLMSLDKTELKIVMKSGQAGEKKLAETIYPIRKTGNYLLCTLLLGNVIVNNGLTILFDDLTSGFVALILASLGIVIFGEIVPQAICSRHGLVVGARTVWLTRFFMVLTFPLAWPISKILDKVLGEEAGKHYTRERLLELIRLSYQSESKNEEILIMSGALELAKKTVGHVMTNLEDVYMLTADAVLDTQTIGEIVQSGYTRIPVFEGEIPRITVVGLLNVKDMALLDPDDAVPVRTVCQFYRHPIRTVMEDMPLMLMLEEFKKGHYHLAFVQRINQEGPGDPYYELVGLVTLEDIIEEIIQSEIVDETDVIIDNRKRAPRRDAQVRDLRLLTLSNRDTADEVGHVSPQLAVAAYQYLSTTITHFNTTYISEMVLQRLIRQNVIAVRPDPDPKKVKLLYERGKPADYFVLILEGHIEVTIGDEDFMFEAGPFFSFGKQVISNVSSAAPRLSITAAGLSENICRNSTFIPDFTAKIKQEVTYLYIKTSTYLKAYRATLIQKAKGEEPEKIVQILQNLCPDDKEEECPNGSAAVLQKNNRGRSFAGLTTRRRSEGPNILGKSSSSTSDGMLPNHVEKEIPEAVFLSVDFETAFDRSFDDSKSTSNRSTSRSRTVSVGELPLGAKHSPLLFTPQTAFIDELEDLDSEH